MRPGGGKGPSEKNHPDIIGGGDNHFLDYKNVLDMKWYDNKNVKRNHPM